MMMYTAAEARKTTDIYRKEKYYKDKEVAQAFVEEICDGIKARARQGEDGLLISMNGYTKDQRSIICEKLRGLGYELGCEEGTFVEINW